MEEELAERVAYLEREMQRTLYVVDGIQKHSNTQFIAINAHLDKQDKDMHDLKANVKKVESDVQELKSDVRELKSSVADITANNIEIRNILAKIVQKLG